MPTIANFLTNDRATSIGDLIAIKPTTITVVRAGVAQAAQTVRLETLASQRMVEGSGGVTHLIDGMVLGYRNHPVQDDTDLQPGDRFRADSTDYEIVAVMPAHVDCIQAYVRIRS